MQFWRSARPRARRSKKVETFLLLGSHRDTSYVRLVEFQRRAMLRGASSTLLLERAQRLRRTARRLFSAGDSAGKPLKLFQYQICPFCNIVKSTLDYTKVPYETIEVNPLTKAEIKSEPLSGEYKKVPSECPLYRY